MLYAAVIAGSEPPAKAASAIANVIKISMDELRTSNAARPVQLWQEHFSCARQIQLGGEQEVTAVRLRNVDKLMLHVFVVDLDGTLLRSDMLFESFLSVFGRNWRNPLLLIATLPSRSNASRILR